MIRGSAFPLLISGCHFSVVDLILSFCLYPSIIPPRLPAFVRNEGGHLSSMLPLPSSLSSQTTMVASVWQWTGKTLFFEHLWGRVRRVDSGDVNVFLDQMLGPSYSFELLKHFPTGGLLGKLLIYRWTKVQTCCIFSKSRLGLLGSPEKLCRYFL